LKFHTHLLRRYGYYIRPTNVLKGWFSNIWSLSPNINRVYNYSLLAMLSMEKIKHECRLQTNVGSHLSSKLTLSFRVIYSIVILGLLDDHLPGGFQNETGSFLITFLWHKTWSSELSVCSIVNMMYQQYFSVIIKFVKNIYTYVKS